MKILIETAEAFDMRTQIIVMTDGKVRHAGHLTDRERELMTTVLEADRLVKERDGGYTL